VTVSSPARIASGPVVVPAASPRTTPWRGATALHDDLPAARHLVRPAVVMTVLVASVVPWRTGVIYEGGLDPVVAAKAFLAAVALVLALTGAPAGRDGRHLANRVGPVAVAFLLAYLGIAFVGGVSAGLTTSTSVLVVRVLMVAATIVAVVHRSEPRVVVRSLLLALGIVGAVSALSGLQIYLAGGRLAGTLPALSPNEIALLLGLPLVGVVHRLLVQRATAGSLALLVVLTGLFVTTGSRAAFLAVLVAVAVAVVAARRVRPTVAVVVAVAVPLAVALLASTDVLARVIERGGDSASIATLNSRTIAWNTVLQTDPGTWARWIGSGLTVKQVPVAGQYWAEQVLDSSWISALAQAGVVGAGLLAIWVVVGLATAGRASLRVVGFGAVLPAFVFIVIRSVVESGLVDSSSAFVAFFTLVVLAESAPRPRSVTP
jgi:hypothetical protein